MIDTDYVLLKNIQKHIDLYTLGISFNATVSPVSLTVALKIQAVKTLREKNMNGDTKYKTCDKNGNKYLLTIVSTE